MEENHYIRHITTTFTNDYNSNSNSLVTDADRLFQNSLVKQTIRGYSPPESTCENRPLVTSKDNFFIHRTQPTNVSASFLVDSIVVLGVAPYSIDLIYSS